MDAMDRMDHMDGMDRMDGWTIWTVKKICGLAAASHEPVSVEACYKPIDLECGQSA